MQLGVLLSAQEARVARGVASYVLSNLHNSIVALSRSPSIQMPMSEYQGSFRINGARTYNTLPRIIRPVETLSEFKIKLKRHFKL